MRDRHVDAYARAGGLACVNPILDPALPPAAGLVGPYLDRVRSHR
jgi:hypothetical protein